MVPRSEKDVVVDIGSWPPLLSCIGGLSAAFPQSFLQLRLNSTARRNNKYVLIYIQTQLIQIPENVSGQTPGHTTPVYKDLINPKINPKISNSPSTHNIYSACPHQQKAYGEHRLLIFPHCVPLMGPRRTWHNEFKKQMVLLYNFTQCGETAKYLLRPNSASFVVM